MADEIRFNVDMSLANGSVKHDYRPSTFSIDQTTANYENRTVSIATSATTVDFGAFTTKGYIYLENLDATNYITFGPDSTGQVTVGRLNPGDFAVFRCDNSATLKATADTAACKMLVVQYEA